MKKNNNRRFDMERTTDTNQFTDLDVSQLSEGWTMTKTFDIAVVKTTKGVYLPVIDGHYAGGAFESAAEALEVITDMMKLEVAVESEGIWLDEQTQKYQDYTDQ